MIKEYEAFLKKMMIFADLLVLAVSFILAYYLRANIYFFYRLDLFPSRVIMGTIYPLDNYLWLLLIILPVWYGLLSSQGLYESFRTKRLTEIVWIIVKAGFVATLITGTLIFIFKLTYVSRIFMFFFLAISVSLLSIEKIMLIQSFKHARPKEDSYKHLLVVGTGKRAGKFVQMVKQHPEWGIKIVGIIDDEPEKVGTDVSNIKVIGLLKDIPDILHAKIVDEVVFIIPRSWLSRIEQSILSCEREGIKVSVAVDLFDFKIGKLQATDLGGIPLMRLETTPGSPWELFMKRSLDIIVSLVGLVLLAPVLLLKAVVIKLNYSGPLFFKQVRNGMNGRKFTLLKFRSMVVGAEEMQEELLALNEMDGPVFKIRNDPRMTRIGRFLRKTSLDELPQLINVLKGDMSLVGPRPPIPGEVTNYKTWQRRRLSMRPGITCFWQISGRNEVNFEQWMKLDLEYIDNWSLWLDLKILFKTIPIVLFGIGAR
jgi:exopolysaccharide biosynthesis polyprenyl glycosylphosphotransferase